MTRQQLDDHLVTAMINGARRIGKTLSRVAIHHLEALIASDDAPQ